jgi:hypothetical protein
MSTESNVVKATLAEFQKYPGVTWNMSLTVMESSGESNALINVLVYYPKGSDSSDIEKWTDAAVLLASKENRKGGRDASGHGPNPYSEYQKISHPFGCDPPAYEAPRFIHKEASKPPEDHADKER